MRSVKSIVKIHEVNGYVVSCLFNNGESRKINFQALFQTWNIQESHIAYPLVKDLNAFKKVKTKSGSLVWENIMFQSTDDQGKPMQQCFGLDPIVLYEASEEDTERSLMLGGMIKKARKELGLTQEELAQKSGTSKHYISRIENNRSGIELMTLKKIVEGLGKRLEIRFK